MSDLIKLKQRVESLEKENQLLKKSLFELSLKTNANKSVQPFQLKELLEDNGMDQITTLFDSKADEDSRHHHHYISGKKEKNKFFYLKSELKGHAGAIYTVKFSPCGRWIASGSFDRTVRIWDANSPKELNCLQGHGLNISEVSWSNGSEELLSGGYDQTCRVWDVEHAKQLESFESDGFVQCVQFCPKNSQLFFCGTSRNILSIIDRRQHATASMNLRNESMVNTISVFQNGTFVVSGDATGCLKTWDVRTGKCIQSFLNEASKKPISHIATCPSSIPDEEPRYMAVNSYDNVMRVYDRGSVFPSSSYTLIHALKGYKNKNWPIRSCFYKFPKDNFPSFGHGASSEDVDLMESNQRDISVDNASEVNSLLATGSADPFVYVYNLGESEGTSNLLQRLEGHTDRVYTCHFHPSEPLLASGSADFTIKLWNLALRKRAK